MPGPAFGWPSQTHRGGPHSPHDEPRWPYCQEMTSGLPPLEISALSSERLWLKPLAVEDSREMAPLLDDPQLHRYIGGKPLSADDLRALYARQSVGRSKDGDERWLNWIVRLRDNDHAVGYVQATVTLANEQPTADVAWVIGSRYQTHGYATEAALLMVDWLRSQTDCAITAHIHPDHLASEAVASRLGLHPTTHVVDDEILWAAGSP